MFYLFSMHDLVPQKTLIPEVQFKFWKNNPGPQADTASYRLGATRGSTPSVEICSCDFVNIPLSVEGTNGLGLNLI